MDRTNFPNLSFASSRAKQKLKQDLKQSFRTLSKERATHANDLKVFTRKAQFRHHSKVGKVQNTICSKCSSVMAKFNSFSNFSFHTTSKIIPSTNVTSNLTKVVLLQMNHSEEVYNALLNNKYENRVKP